MSVIVTGGTGFLGSQLVRQLLSRGEAVRALARRPQDAHGLAQMGAEVVQGDITDRGSLRAAMRGAQGIYHVAGWYKIGVRDRETAYAVNVEGTRNVLELMAELSIPRGVYTSSLVVNSNTKGAVVDESHHFAGEHISLYDETKAEAHHRVAKPWIERGLPLTIVMPGVIYGPGDRSVSGDAIREYLRGRLPMLPKDSAACWGHVEDVAHGHILAMEEGEIGETYIIAGPCHRYTEVFQQAEAISGVPAPRLQAPAWLLKVMSLPLGLVEWALPLPPAYTSEGLRVSAGVTYLGSNAKARRHLGYRPRSLEEGLRQALPAYQAEVART